MGRNGPRNVNPVLCNVVMLCTFVLAGTRSSPIRSDGVWERVAGYEEIDVGMFGDRRVGGYSSDDISGYGSAADDAGNFPLLHEFVTRMRYDDGKAREKGTVLIFVEGGRLKACLNDKSDGLTGWIAVDSLETALADVERALKDDKVDWRRKRGERGAGHNLR